MSRVRVAFGMSSVIFYLLIYAFTNIGAFAVLIVMSRVVPDEDITSYTGLGRRSPWLAAALAFCLLSLAGLPPLAGFVGKFYIFWAVAQQGLYWLVAAGVINSAISLYYYARVIRQMYLVETPLEAPVEGAVETMEVTPVPRGPRVGFAPALSLVASVLSIFVMIPLAGLFISAALDAARMVGVR